MDPKLSFILVLLFLGVQNSDGAKGHKRKNISHMIRKISKLFRGSLNEEELFNGEEWKKVANMFGLKRSTWNTTLPSQNVVNETAFVSEARNVLLMMSRDRSLKSEGYDKSVTMMDFDTGLTAFRVRLPRQGKKPENKNRRQLSKRGRRMNRLRKFFGGKFQACFVTDSEVNLSDVQAELQRRINASSVLTGTHKKFVVEQGNKIAESDLSAMSSKIARFCRKATKKGNAFKLVTESTVTTDSDTINILGQFDKAQPSTSVPYEIHLESSLVGTSKSTPAPNSSTSVSPAARTSSSAPESSTQPPTEGPVPS